MGANGNFLISYNLYRSFVSDEWQHNRQMIALLIPPHIESAEEVVASVKDHHSLSGSTV
ncbi:MAG: hypothetical protein PUP93_21940 [Rhizonema sp. NSF051]|nr:hypothetical protein [Rhizonema sp. NSF051]